MVLVGNQYSLIFAGQGMGPIGARAVRVVIGAELFSQFWETAFAGRTGMGLVGNQYSLTVWGQALGAHRGPSSACCDRG